MTDRVKPIPLRAIAEKANVTRMTVSLALRNSPRITLRTRERVQAIARNLGYSPDPVLSEVMARLRTATRARSAITIALITNQHGGLSWKKILTHRLYVEGARAQAAALGFQVEQFCLYADGMTEQRLSQVMAARGVEGAIVFPFVRRTETANLKFEWAKFAFATCGYSLQAPILHRSCFAHMRGMMDACRRLRAAGYRRMGLVLDADQDRRVGHNWTAGFLAANHLVPTATPQPVFRPETVTFANFSAWFREQRPDVVLHIGREGDILDWIRRCGARVPDDVGYVFLDLWDSMAGISGIDQQSRQVGAAAIDLVVAGIRHHERGIPEHSKIVLCDGAWRDGATTRTVR